MISVKNSLVYNDYNGCSKDHVKFMDLLLMSTLVMKLLSVPILYSITDDIMCCHLKLKIEFCYF